MSVRTRLGASIKGRFGGLKNGSPRLLRVRGTGIPAKMLSLTTVSLDRAALDRSNDPDRT
jgi:hypothetical protein